MDHTVLSVLLLAFFATSSALDSEGTHFVFAFVRNANAANISNQELSLSVLNQNAMDCKFTLTSRPDYHKSTPPENITQTVLSMNDGRVNIPSWYGWNYAGYNVQDDVFLTLTAYSTCPVTVIAHNVDTMTGQGDSFMVLPTFWGSKSFTFSLPPAVISGEQQYEQVFVLPTTDGVTRVNVMEIGNAQSVYSFNVTYGNAPAVYIGARTPDKRPRTYHVTSDKDVLIVAGVTCAGADINSCDHVAYMPHPPPASDCYPYDYYDDDHVSYLPTTAQFFADIPGTCLIGQDITSTLNDGLVGTMTIKPQMESPLWTIRTTSASQKGVAFHNGGSNIHIARYFDGSRNGTLGAFIATSPSVTQFHNDNTAFYTRNVNDSLEIYCDVLACAAITIDGVKISITDTQVVQKVDGVSYYIFVIAIAKQGFHQISLSQKGSYSFFVFGKNMKYSYGYVGGVNKPTFVLAPPTTTTKGPSTASVSTVSTLTPPTTNPVTTQTTQTTAAPPATASPTTPGTMTPAPSTATTITVPTVSTVTTQASTVTTSTAKPAQTSVTTPAITSTTGVPPPTTVTTKTPVVTTSTNTPVITTTTTKSPVVTSQTTQSVPTPQTSSPTTQSTSTIKPSSPSTAGPTTPSVAPPVTTTTAAPPVTTKTTAPPPPPSTTTTTKPQPPVSTTTKPAQPTSSTAPVTSPSTVPVTSPSTAPVTKPVPSSSTTTTTTTTQAPSTSTQSSSVVSLTVPVVLTIFFALFKN